MGSAVSLKPGYAEELGREVGAYIDAGFKVIPLPHRSKAPKVKGWKDRTFGPGDFRGDANLALRLDAGLTDVDFDWQEARDLGPAILPLTAHFGRDGSFPGHALYTCSGLEKSIKYALPASVSEDRRFAGQDHALMVLEIRVDQSTMVPPSIHPSGEQLRWGQNTDVVEIEATELQRSCGLIAFLSVVLRCYPASGSRNDVGIALSGALVRAGYSAAEADDITRMLAEYAGDEEASQRGAGESAAKRLAEGKDVSGLPKLCELLGLPDEVATVFAKWLGQSEIDAATIILDNDREPENLDRMDDVFAASDLPHYQRLGRRVHIVRQASTGEEGKGPLVIRECSPRVIQQDVERRAKFAKWDARRDAYVSAQCPDRLAEMYLVKSNGWRVPELRGVRESPTIRGDGTILQTPGYDEKTGYLYDPRLDYPTIPEFPTKAEAMAALAELEDVLKDFKFASESDKAVALAGFIMSAIRPALETAPMIGIDAPQFGAGKTLLANLIHIVGHGVRPTAKGWAKDETENEKRLFSSLMGGEAVYFMDNVAKDAPIGGEALATILTQPTWAARKLGVSEQPAVSTRALFMATGVNLTFAADLVRRSLKTRIEPGVERPENREFSYDVVADTIANHPRLLAAALTVVRAYVVAGSPMAGKFKPLGSFGDFDRLVRAPLMWLGRVDPVETQRDIEAVDPEADTLVRGLELLELVFKGKAFQVRDIAALAAKSPLMAGEAALVNWIRENTPQSRDAASINTRALGLYLKSKRGTPRGGRKLEMAEPGTAVAGGKLGRDGTIWRIVRMVE